ncbi:putative type II haloacid dehalogenase [Nocardia nova SH22a]|uniref:Putative type II haloacid dehalogenase n=1 Tax=Nocardia nova SH22a TaxID=1415166 RepID=W5TS33_9NOCA|nr:haloacid dehalogenase type II [Nocardia nova]AHH21954.1 putative type II haloacid dehalogenase [Nocardia nova SH22a]
MPPVEALLFDVQGTATDFHTTVCTAAADIARDRFPDVDWARFVNEWRAAYFRATSTPRTAADPWISVAGIYRTTLGDLLDERGIGLTGPERDQLAAAWSRLRPWPDVVPGLRRLRTRYTLATLSNADVSAVVGITRHGDLPWHAVFTAEMAGVFKPDPAIYAMAARYLGLEPARIMMVASHKYDIRAAGALGFRTAFVARPLEFGAGSSADTEFSDEFDLNVTGFEDLADRLGCPPD